jgi:dCMP deaminase
MLIGLTGKYAAGKGTVAEALKARGFGYHSCSDILREELRARGVAESREALLALGNELRRAGGPGELARRLTPRLADGADHIVDSIRNPAEVEALRELDGFVLLAVDASPDVRFTRLRARNRIGDPETYAAFQALEDRELVSDDPTTQQLNATIALADHHLHNDGEIGELHATLAALLTQLGSA